MKDFVAWLMITCGVFGALGGTLNWGFFMESRKAQLFVKLIGRTGARAFYVILGLTVIVLGVCGLLGYIDLSRSRS